MEIEDKKKLREIYCDLADISFASQDEILRQAVKIYLFEKYYGEKE